MEWVLHLDCEYSENLESNISSTYKSSEDSGITKNVMPAKCFPSATASYTISTTCNIPSRALDLHRLKQMPIVRRLHLVHLAFY